MKYLFLDSFAFLSPCMLSGALYDMTKNIDVLKKLCDKLTDVRIYADEEKRCGMEAGFLRLDYPIEKEKITKSELVLMCESFLVSGKTKEKLLKYIDIVSEAKSIDPEFTVFDAKASTDSLIFMAYIFETISSLKIEKVYVSNILIPSEKFYPQSFSEKISNSVFILKKHNVTHTPTPIFAPSFSEEWAAMCAILNASHKDTHTGNIIKIGYGAGEDDTDEVPNILRAVYGEEEDGDVLFEAEMALNLNFEFSKATVLSEA